ncbi:MAG: aminoglycoside phosphotransferase [Gemmatimonadetes bacterium]|nr:aminoglycoside phosphotransferase [Gemmatimonadota bacterium]
MGKCGEYLRASQTGEPTIEARLSNMVHDLVDYRLLNDEDREDLEEYLRQRGWLREGERVVDVSRAGEGNMNCTLRVCTERRSCIAKQSRPWVEKYPSIPAPDSRIAIEALFYSLVASTEAVATRMPRLLDFDEGQRVMLLEDLGETADFMHIYGIGAGRDVPLQSLCGWLSALHESRFDRQTQRALENRGMRVLNHEHIFDLPLQSDNGLDLDELTAGLSASARALKEHAQYAQAVKDLGQRYLGEGTSLLHGDFYPGSWVESGNDVWIIDPEFCFLGPAEFDVGVFVAHLLLAGKPLEYAFEVFACYDGPIGFSRHLALGFAGVEIMRRLLGVAQLPLRADLEAKKTLLTLSRRLVLEPDYFG